MNIKGGYLDFSHLIDLEKTNITEIYMGKTHTHTHTHYKSSITKNHEIKQKYILMVFP